MVEVSVKYEEKYRTTAECDEFVELWWTRSIHIRGAVSDDEAGDAASKNASEAIDAHLQSKYGERGVKSWDVVKNSIYMTRVLVGTDDEHDYADQDIAVIAYLRNEAERDYVLAGHSSTLEDGAL